MKISVVIPTYNRRELLGRTLATLFAQDFPSDEYEVVVAVDGSTDGTAAFLRGLQPPCRLRIVEHSRNLGQSAARNSALKAAQGEFVLFIDDDDLCDRALLKAHVAAHDGVPSLVVAGPVFVARESPVALTTDRLRKTVEDSLPTRGHLQWMEGAGPNTSAARCAVLDCGGFDERLSRMSEDVDLMLRLWKKGARFHYEPNAIAHTVYVKSASDLVREATCAGQNQILLCRKEPDYRPYSGLAGLGRGSWWNRFMRGVCARLPASPQPLLAVPTWIAERFRGIEPVRNFGIQMIERRMAIAAYRGALSQTGSWDALRREFGMRLPVLLYHHVGPRGTRNHPELTVSPQRFEMHLRWLARRGYCGIRPSDWLAWLRGGKALPPKPVLITFDDGYADLPDYAFAALRRYGFSAAVYIITGKIGATVAWDGPDDTESYQLMTAEQIRRWAGEGIEFGAHSRTHPNLTTLGEREIQDEVAGSRMDLEKIAGVRPVSFAYPYGYYNDQVREFVRTEFGLAMSCDEGINDLGTDPWLIRRAMVQPAHHTADLAACVALGWNPLDEIRAYIRLRTRVRAMIQTAGHLAGYARN